MSPSSYLKLSLVAYLMNTYWKLESPDLSKKEPETALEFVANCRYLRSRREAQEKFK